MVRSEYTVYVTYELPDDVHVGMTMNQGHEFYLRASSRESPERAIALAQLAAARILDAVESEGADSK